MSFFPMSQSTSQMFMHNFEPKNEKQPYQTVESYQNAGNLSSNYSAQTNFPYFQNQTASLSDWKIAQKNKNFLEASNSGAQRNSRENYSSCSAFSNYKPFIFHQNKNVCAQNDLIRPEQKTENYASENNEFDFEQSKLKLSEYLNNEFNAFKKEIKFLGIKQNECDSVLENIEKQVSFILEPYVNMISSSSEEIEGDLKILSTMVRTNTTFINQKLKAINRKLEDILKNIEIAFAENNNEFKSLKKKLEDFGKLFITTKSNSKTMKKKKK